MKKWLFWYQGDDTLVQELLHSSHEANLSRLGVWHVLEHEIGKRQSVKLQLVALGKDTLNPHVRDVWGPESLEGQQTPPHNEK